MIDLAIMSNHIITPGGPVKGGVLISNGLVTDIVAAPPDYARAVMDIGDKCLLTGIIDPHVHINEPGRTHWEGFDTATRPALAGDRTTLVDMPLNASPVTTTA